MPEEFLLSFRTKKSALSNRFGGLLPVVVDIETSGLNPTTDGLLELAAVTLFMNDEGKIFPDQTYVYHIEPFVGANLDERALAITGIRPFEPLRYAITELQALHQLFSKVRQALEDNQCQRAILVGHNAWFDLAFIKAALKRCPVLVSPFHSFTTIDTASLSAVALKETVLARAVKAAKIDFDISQAHSARYDAEKTAELFCYIVNRP